MLQDRLAKGIYALLGLVLLGAALLLSTGTPIASAGPPLALTATAEPPTPTVPTVPTATTVPATPTPLPGEPTATPVPAPTDGPNDDDDRFADPAVSKEADRDEVSLGETITFRITVTNEGNDTAQGVIVEDSLPSSLEVVSASVDRGQAVINGNTVGFWIGDVEPGEVIRGEVTARVVAIPSDGIIVNRAVLRSNNSSDRPQNNESGSRVRVRPAVPTPTSEPNLAVVQPTPTPPPVAQQPPAGLPVTAGATSLPIPAWVIVLTAVGYVAIGFYFWRRPRK